MKRYFILFFVSLFCLISTVSALTKAPVDITTMSINDLSNALDKGYITSEQLVNLYLERIEKYDEQFNSINQLNPDAIKQAKELDKERANGKIRGKLHGIPIVVKCNIDVLGIPTTAGAKSLKDNYPKQNSDVVQKLVDEGAIILASTNMSEFAFSASQSLSSYGYVRNVFNRDYTPYGSSGGSAVATKAAFAAASLGTDTNSSVRLPASGAGLVGIRPTLGNISSDGVIPYDIERDTVGVLTRSVSDNALLLGIINNKDTKYDLSKTSLKGVNIGVATQYTKGSGRLSGVMGSTDSDIYNLIEKSIKELEDAGANIIYLDNFVKYSNLDIADSTMSGSTMCDGFNRYIKGTTGTIRSFQQLVNSGGHIYGLGGYVSSCGNSSHYKSSRDSKKSVYREYVNEVFEENKLDVLLYPTLKNKVFAYNGSGNISPGSTLGSVIGYPSITVPMGFVDDFSYGLELLSLANDEQKLYNVALEYEKINNNKVATSPLTPSLYEIPKSVSNLVKLYNEEKIDDKEWREDVLEFFKNYNDIDDVDKTASKLIEDHEVLKIKIEKKNSRFKRILIIFIIVTLLYVFRRSVIRIIRRIIKIIRRIKKRRMLINKRKKNTNKRTAVRRTNTNVRKTTNNNSYKKGTNKKKNTKKKPVKKKSTKKKSNNKNRKKR